MISALRDHSRIGVLLVEIAELLRRAFEIALFEPGEALVVELLGRDLRHDLHLVLLGAVERD